jgi:hypothetical protein
VTDGDSDDIGGDVPRTMIDGEVNLSPSGPEVIAATRQSMQVVTNDAHLQLMTTATTATSDRMTMTASRRQVEKVKSDEEQLTQRILNTTDVLTMLENSTEGFVK